MESSFRLELVSRFVSLNSVVNLESLSLSSSLISSGGFGGVRLSLSSLLISSGGLGCVRLS